MSRLPAVKRREQLLDKAAELFAKSGYAKATTAQLAKAAGVTEPIIYRHFKSKRDLFVALVERTGRETIEQWERQMADAEDPAARLRILIGENPMVSERGRLAYLVILQGIAEVDDPEINKALNHHMRGLHEFLLSEVRRAQEEHKVAHRFSAEIIAWLLIHLGLGYGVLSAMGVKGHGQDSEGRHVQEVVARVLVGKAGTET